MQLKNGNNVTLVEERFIGGKCLNQACMVVCALSDVSKHLLDSENFNDLGILDCEVKVHYEKITGNIRETQKKITKIITAETENTGVDFVQGYATINADDKVVVVNDEEYSYDKLLICTGSSPYVPNIKGSENALTYKDALKIKEIPKKW